MAREVAPMLFGRKMRKIGPSAWRLSVNPFDFTLSMDSGCYVIVSARSAVLFQRDYTTQSRALAGLTTYAWTLSLILRRAIGDD